MLLSVASPSYPCLRFLIVLTLPSPPYTLQVNINRDGHWNRQHTHAGASWSGIYYIQSNKESLLRNYRCAVHPSVRGIVVTSQSITASNADGIATSSPIFSCNPLSLSIPLSRPLPSPLPTFIQCFRSLPLSLFYSTNLSNNQLPSLPLNCLLSPLPCTLIPSLLCPSGRLLLKPTSHPSESGYALSDIEKARCVRCSNLFDLI